jgi:hypothetical protein
MTLQEEKKLLLRVVTRLAAKLIGEGGFVPFGAPLGPGLNVKLLMPKGWKENATRDELEAYWSRELKKATTEAECKTVCSGADLRVPMDNGDLAPGIFIHLEQVGSPAEDIVYPYLKGGISEAKLGTPTSVETESRVFAASQTQRLAALVHVPPRLTPVILPLALLPP